MSEHGTTRDGGTSPAGRQTARHPGPWKVLATLVLASLGLWPRPPASPPRSPGGGPDDAAGA